MLRFFQKLREVSSNSLPKKSLVEPKITAKTTKTRSPTIKETTKVRCLMVVAKLLQQLVTILDIKSVCLLLLLNVLKLFLHRMSESSIQ